MSLIARLYAPLFLIWRRKRHQMFVQKLRPKTGQGGDRMLDVGGYPAYWSSLPAAVTSVDCLNIHEVNWTTDETAEQRIRVVLGNGCAMPEYAAQSYDIVFSNSVIEHVGDWSQQQAFAAEVRRVAKRLWIQTPAYECPFEPHYLAPFVHYAPLSMRRWVVRWLTPWSWITWPSLKEIDDAVSSIRLITKPEFESLFPDCEILTERFLWLFPKSYIAVRGGADRAEG